MYRVRLTTSFPNQPIIRQTPGLSGDWGQFHFAINQPVEDYQFWVLFDRFSETQKGHCAEANTIFITAEPPSLAHYSQPFIAQFATVLTCHRYIQGPDVIFSQQALPWQIGIRGYHANDPSEANLDYNCLKTAVFEKRKVISVISSSRRGTRGHALRFDFIQRLRERLGNRIDIFGAGIRDIEDKWDGIAPYKYHIAIENSVIPDYWTEKLADAFLGGAYPIYHGCPNIHDYFSKQAMRQIDISNADRAIDEIEAVIAAGEYERNQNQLQEARRLVLDEYNLFPMLAKLLSMKDANAAKVDIEFKPLGEFEGLARRMARSVTRRLPPSIRRFIK
jgi:Glycosyltransferase family 10 (fucosyltransferase) C-term